MSHVIALRDVVTDHGLKVASRGQGGTALKGAVPHEEGNFGKVAVRWFGRRRVYWIPPTVLKFLKGSPEEYTAVPPVKAALPAVKIPANSGCHKFNFGFNLKLCREARTWSQEELSRKMSRFGGPFTQSTVCYREKQNFPPGGDFIVSAARALALPPYVFLLDLRNCDSLQSAGDFLAPLTSSICEAQ